MQITTLAGALMVMALLVPTMCKAGDGPLVTQAVHDKVDPKHQLSESQRTMAALSAIWQYHNNRGEPEKAQRAVAAMLQNHRINKARYEALRSAANQGGHPDPGATYAARIYVGVPGKDLKITKDQYGRLIARGTDEATGKVITKKIMTPAELGAALTGVPAESFEKLLAEDVPVARTKQRRTPAPPAVVVVPMPDPVPSETSPLMSCTTMSLGGGMTATDCD
jgi:hypothetical protein